MWSQLQPFERPSLDLNIKAKVWHEAAVLKIAYDVTNEIEKILLPKPLAVPRRVIGLWESTCFEMFIKNQNREEYLEFNVTSEYNWNVFHFPKYRSSLKEYLNIANLGLAAVKNDNSFSLSYWLPLDRLPEGFWEPGQMKIGLTAVVEDLQKGLSYWALDHSDEKPNFHNQKSFSFRL